MVAMRTELTYKLTKGLLLRAGSDVQVDSYDVLLNVGQVSAAEASVFDASPRAPISRRASAPTWCGAWRRASR